VESVAAEMEVELGIDKNAAPVLAEVRPLHRQIAAMAGEQGLGSSVSSSAQGAYQTPEERIAALEERIEMLEASSGMMFNLIRKILRILRVGGANSSANVNESTGT